MKASARNRFAGLVASIREGSVNDEVELLTPSGLRVVATVTGTSRELLGLKIGSSAFALVKASSVVLVTQAEGVLFSARNQFQGAVGKVSRGAINSEIVLNLLGGEQLVAVVTNDSADELGLTVGEPTLALFKVSSVILGVEA